MKQKIKALAFILSLLLTVTACNGTIPDNTEWENNAQLEAQQSADELYKAALDEDVLHVYAVSERIYSVAESFMEEYPGLVAEVTYMRSEELTEKLKSDAENGTITCDVIYITNGDGALTETLIPDKLAYKYVPYDIKDKLNTNSSDEYLSVLYEMALLCYNDEYYSEPPISNWWELTDEKWYGLTYITDSSKSMISYTVFAMMEQHDAEMRKAYFDYYKTELITENGVSATNIFLEMLIKNGLNIVNSSDDIASAIATPGSKSAAVGILNASKMRMRTTGYPISACYELSPFTGVINPANIMLAGGSKNINSAKLFIRWILGETDGTGEGYKPFLQEGAWSTRTDIVSGATKSLDEITAIYTDEKFSYKYRDDFLSFWDRKVSEYLD